MTKDRIGIMVANERKARGWTRYRLAKESGLRQDEVKFIEESMTAYSIDKLLRACDALGINLKK